MVIVALKVFVAVAVKLLVNVELVVEVKVKVGVELAVKVKVLVAVFEKVAVGVAVAGWGIICIEDTMALSTLAGPKVIVMAPPVGAILLNTLSTAMFSPPAVAKISKLVNSVVPLTDTLNSRSPAAVQ